MGGTEAPADLENDWQDLFAEAENELANDAKQVYLEDHRKDRLHDWIDLSVRDMAIMSSVLADLDWHWDVKVEIKPVPTPIEEKAQKSANATSIPAGQPQNDTHEVKVSFAKWLAQFDAPVVNSTVSPKKKKKKYRYELIDGEWTRIKVKKKKKESPKTIARESLRDNPDVATQTLAKLLEDQGHYRRAVLMYEQLSLQMPEKSNFFAAKIEALLSKVEFKTD